jgi:hypothetical protein
MMMVVGRVLLRRQRGLSVLQFFVSQFAAVRGVGSSHGGRCTRRYHGILGLGQPSLKVERHLEERSWGTVCETQRGK